MLGFCRCGRVVEKACRSVGSRFVVRGVALCFSTVGPWLFRSVHVGNG